jgi:hypothetical protein
MLRRDQRRPAVITVFMAQIAGQLSIFARAVARHRPVAAAKLRVCLSIPHIQAEIDVELSNLIQEKNRFPVGI